ncbi:asparagine synthase-related protein [Streptomyces sp. HPF1205]|uniref:asparagine synthase-related protein n=1 Tax=Streptomyces sp. HPF1205 TaxID=2873262 RepID=UPI001CEDAC38|nr:asparagine synthase-related protein [Streptomyces sp. HPF1205]
MTPHSRWCVVANVPVPGLAPAALHADLGGVQAYYRGPLGAVLPADPPFVLDVRTMSVVPGEAPDAEAAADGARPGPPGGATVLRADADAVTVRVSALSEDPLYFAANRLCGRFAYFTDLLLAALVLPALGLPVEVQPHPEPGLVRGVRRLPHSATARTYRTAGGWVNEVRDEPDPLDGFRAPHRRDPVAAGEAQIQALSEEIARIGATAPAGCATLLSGGIDSGTVTWLAAAGGLSVAPYSVATPWGDELDDAAELCAEAGLTLHPVHLTEEEIVSSIPEAIRWLGCAEPEVVEVALTATAVQRTGAVPGERVLITGYGSDLINAGLYRPYTRPEELTGQVLAAVDATRRTGELSRRMALAYGTAVSHPFWSWPVMRVALETAPECKVVDGREKYHLRTAMATRVPAAVAWRRKIAVHHGGGLQQGVVRRLEKETGSRDRHTLYRACFAELLDLAAESSFDAPDPAVLLTRAITRATGS